MERSKLLNLQLIETLVLVVLLISFPCNNIGVNIKTSPYFILINLNFFLCFLKISDIDLFF